MRSLLPASGQNAAPRLWALALVTVALAARGGIEYDAALDAYRVTDYPEEYPCTPTLLARMDALLGLGKMTHAPGASTWRLTCNLVIGANDGTDTYFQIGSTTAPRERHVVRGNVTVCPYHIQGENTSDQWWVARQRINRLTIGDERDPTVRAALTFDAPDSKTHFSLATGERPQPNGKPATGRGGQLLVWNGLVTAQRQEKGWEIGGLRLRGDGFVFVNSTLSWVKGMMTYGASVGWRNRVRVEDSLFEHGATAIVGGKQDLRRCRFVRCGTAVLDYGSLDVTLTECAFQGNRHNFRLRFPGKGSPGLRCIDCTFGPPEGGNPMQQQETATVRQWREKGHTLRKPQCLSLRHLVVEVRDQSGAPLPGADIAVRPEQAGAETDPGRRYRTGPTGRTEGKDGERAEAILLPEWSHTVHEAGDADTGPITFSYTVTAAYGGRTAALRNVRPDQSWKVVTLALSEPE